MSAQGVVLETNGPQVWSWWTPGRPFGGSRVAKRRPRIDFGRILDRFWEHLGRISEDFWEYVDTFRPYLR